MKTVMLLGTVGFFAFLIFQNPPSLKYQEGKAEKEPEKVISWQIPLESGRALDVIDTAGVCIYLYTSSAGNSMRTVLKSQLPIGVGCQ